nr:unnamed protein product [Callosobruchus chinensis]
MYIALTVFHSKSCAERESVLSSSLIVYALTGYRPVAFYLQSGTNFLIIMFKVWLVIATVPFGFGLAEQITADNVPPYIKQCREGDPEMIKCFIGAIHHLRPYLAQGIPEIELPSVEPFKMEELTLSLTTGPNGYRVSLKDIDVFGASNFTVRKMRYESSGVLIILPASGNGTFNGQLEGVEATVRGRTSINEKENLRYLHVDALHVDLVVRNIRLLVKNVYKNNAILTQAINLFLRENGMEVFKVMLPQLRKKLAVLFMSIANSLLSHVPLEAFYLPKGQ